METHHHHNNNTSQQSENLLKLSLSATFHCLLGCGLGEIAGMIISVWFGLAMTSSTIISIISGFIGGLALGIVPLVRRNIPLTKALKIVIIGEGLSIGVMEAFEVLTQLLIPGVMNAWLSDPIFWIGMAASLIAGFVAAFPINYFMIKRGVRHIH